MAMIVSGRHTVYTNRQCNVKVVLNGRIIELPISEPISVDVPFTQFVNLLELFNKNMELYDRFCSVLKGSHSKNERVFRSKEFIKSNIIPYIDGTIEMGYEEFSNIIIQDIQFINTYILDEHAVCETILKTLKPNKEHWVLEQETQKQRDSIKRKIRQVHTQQRMDKQMKAIFSDRIVRNITCKYGDSCKYKNMPTPHNRFIPCKNIHPSDLV